MHCIRNLMFDICAIAIKSFVFIHYLLVDTYFKKDDNLINVFSLLNSLVSVLKCTLIQYNRIIEKVANPIFHG